MGQSVEDRSKFEASAKPYDRDLDAGRVLDEALGHAQARSTKILIVFGDDWCPDCRILSGMMAQPEVRAILDRAYETHSIPVGQYDLNMDIPVRLGLEGLEGVPALVVADGQGRLLNRPDIFAWRSARTRTLDELVDDLERWADLSG